MEVLNMLLEAVVVNHLLALGAWPDVSDAVGVVAVELGGGEVALAV